jgi:hypothetical protein
MRMLASGISESDFLAIIGPIAKKLSVNARIPGHQSEDIEQEIVVMGLNAIKRYVPEKGKLEHFLFHHCKLRLANFFRDRVTRSRNDAPCEKCASGEPCRGGQQYCRYYEDWLKRNTRKKDLASTHSMSDGEENGAKCVLPEEDRVDAAELLQIIDEFLPVSLRADYLRMKDGTITVPFAKRQLVNNAIVEIFKDSGMEPEEWGWKAEKPLKCQASKWVLAGEAMVSPDAALNPSGPQPCGSGVC